MHQRSAASLLITVVLAGCSTAAVSTATPATAPPASPTATATVAASPAATPTRAPTPRPTVPPTPPPGVAAWPKAFDIEMSGTYWSTPPFTIPFTITVEEPGWFSGHLHPTFVDLQRFDGITPHQFPNRMLGFGDPSHFGAAGSPVDATTLTPDAALDLLADRASLTTTNRTPQQLLGLQGARMDLHSATDNNPLFGDPGGNFGLGPQLDVRLVILPRDGRLFVVAVLAAPGDLDAAWEQALPILESVELGD